MYFNGEGHIERFSEALDGTTWAMDMTDDGIVDRYYGTALYLLTATPSIWRKSKDYVSDEAINRGIYFDKMLAEQDFSSQEWIVATLAKVLFESEDSKKFSITNMVGGLEDALFNCCLLAIAYFRDNKIYMQRKKAASLGNE